MPATGAAQPHAYTYGVAGGREAVFDGQWLLKKTGELVDARNLPAEPLEWFALSVVGILLVATQ